MRGETPTSRSLSKSASCHLRRKGAKCRWKLTDPNGVFRGRWTRPSPRPLTKPPPIRGLPPSAPSARLCVGGSAGEGLCPCQNVPQSLRNFPSGSYGRACLQCRRPGFDPWVGKDSLEEEMASHSSILAWKIPWTEEPCRLPSTGSQRVGHNWATSLHFSCSKAGV